jgi:dTDP-4-amino-4,6-dideoxygalactose transaminase
MAVLVSENNCRWQIMAFEIDSAARQSKRPCSCRHNLHNDMQIPTAYKVPLTRPSLPQLDELAGDLRKMLTSGRLTNFGPFVCEFERRAAELVGVQYTASVSSGTTGLCLLLNALRAGSEVVMPSFTFLATAQAVLWNGLIPRFVDIDPHTYCISAESVREHLTRNTSAILAVNVFGAPCAIEELQEIAREKRVALFFDSAHAFGSRHGEKYLGGFGDGEVFSFSATKVLAGCEGGIVATSNVDVFRVITERRNYGFDSDHDCGNMGLNGKMSEFSAILCIRGIAMLDREINRRNALVQAYKDQLSGIRGISFQRIVDGDLSTYKDFTILVDPFIAKMDRDSLAEELRGRGIEVGKYFFPPIHKLRFFRERFPDLTLPNTDRVASEILSLPMYSELSSEQLRFVVDSIKGALGQRAS